MNAKPNPCPPPPPRQKIPKDGVGPRGGVDCYYTSRVLNSTDRYVRFVKKLRLKEEEIRVGVENTEKVAGFHRDLDFFTRCDRRSSINKIESRVKIAWEAYENDLAQKRTRLKRFLAQEYEQQIRQFTIQTQEGTEAAFQEKVQRLLAIKQKEREDKPIPLDKCTHVQPCIVKLRTKEAAEIQLYQMREKQMRKMAEVELDKMWHELAMKESDALAARIEVDLIEEKNRFSEWYQFNLGMKEELRQQRLRDQERLKKEALELKNQRAADAREYAEEQQKKRENIAKALEARNEELKERQAVIAKKKAEEQLIIDTWDEVAGQSLAADNTAEEIARRKQMDLNECNKKLIEMKNRIAEGKTDADKMIFAKEQSIRDEADLKRCQLRKEAQRKREEIREYTVNQIKQKEDEKKKDLMQKTRDEYQRQVRLQLDELVKNKQMTDAQAKKLLEKDLLDQMEYNKLLKERALQEEKDQIKKGKIAKDEYQEAIKGMLSRQFFCDEVHPFMKQMGVPPVVCTCTPLKDTKKK